MSTVSNATDLPLLYKLGKRSEIRYWECRVRGNIYETRYGVLKNRDNHKWSQHKRESQYDPSHGAHKTADQVAMEHAQSLWTEKKRTHAMTEDMNTLLLGPQYQIPIAPVLATRYSDLKKKHESYIRCVNSGRKPSCVQYCFPDTMYYWEYKFDGERGTISWHDDDVHIYSRGRVEIPHLDKQKDMFRKIYNAFGKNNPHIYNYHFDCEIMLPENCRNKMRSAVSRIKDKHPDNDQIVLYVFDIITVYGMPYKERRKILEAIFSKVNSTCVQLVQTLGIAKLGDPIVDEFCASAHELGFEGVMGKDETFIYPVSHIRINELVKYKVEHDDEYEIIGAHEGIDAHAGLIVLEVKDRNDGLITFSVTPAWSHQDRREAWELYLSDPSHFVGRLVTIVYKYKNTYGKPEEARATRIRDNADMSVPDDIFDQPVYSI